MAMASSSLAMECSRRFTSPSSGQVMVEDRATARNSLQRCDNHPLPEPDELVGLTVVSRKRCIRRPQKQ